jgi:hypothetical protein
VQEAASAGIRGLALLQTQLMGGAPVSLDALRSAAAEAEALAAESDESGARLCHAIALRLRIEVAKREFTDAPQPAAYIGTMNSSFRSH